MPSGKCIVLSLIRHGQSGYNVNPVNGIDSPLTPFGRTQVADLGRRWADVRINALYSSPIDRATDTATAILETNKYTKSNGIKLQIESDLKEQNMGGLISKILEYARAKKFAEAEKAQKELHAAVPPGASAENPDRNWGAPEGGESLNEVAARVQHVLRKAIEANGVPLDDLPSSIEASTKVESLPDGINHVVFVSHNVSITELYDLMTFWNNLEPRRPSTEHVWTNTAWSRHLIWLRDDSKELKFHDLCMPSRDQVN